MSRHAPATDIMIEPIVPVAPIPMRLPSHPPSAPPTRPRMMLMITEWDVPMILPASQPDTPPIIRATINDHIIFTSV